MNIRIPLTGKRVYHDTLGRGICIYDSNLDECIVRFDEETSNGDVLKVHFSSLTQLPQVRQAC